MNSLQQKSIPHHGSQVTNLNIFRQYAENHIKERTDVDTENYTFMTRFLQSNENGLPVELYFFITSTVSLGPV